MRTGRLAVLVLVLISILSFPPLARAGEQPRAEPARSYDVLASFELWLLNTMERVEAIFGVNAPPTPVPPGSNSPSVLGDCGSAIDPNGTGCRP
jgi:hypothetical protein